MDAQRDVTDMGGTMRLGAYVAKLVPGSQGGAGLRRRGRVRAPPPPLRVQPAVPQPLRGGRASCARASSPDGRLVEFIELDGHPFWVGTQAHPEFKSRPDRPAPAVPRAHRAPRWPGPRAATRTSSSSTASRPRPLTVVTRRGGAVPPGRRARRSTRATSIWPRRRDASRAPTAPTFERDIVHHPGRGGGGAPARRRPGGAGAPVPGPDRR